MTTINRTLHTLDLSKNLMSDQVVPFFRTMVKENNVVLVDFKFRGNIFNLKYDLIIAPGANAENISWSYVGADALEINDQQLLIKTSVGLLTEEAPIAWQIIDNQISASARKVIRPCPCKSISVSRYCINRSCGIIANGLIVGENFSIFCSIN